MTTDTRPAHVLAAEESLREVLRPGVVVFWASGFTRENEPWFRLFVGTGTIITRITVDAAILLGCRRLKNGRYAGEPWQIVPALATVLFGSADALTGEEL